MSIPQEIELYIISFIPFSELELVCKDWKNEIKSIRKKSLLIIEKFYLKNKIKNYLKTNIDILSSQYYFKTNIDLIRYLCVNYESEYFLPYPDFAVSKLGLNQDLLTLLPHLKDRKRSDVKTWMLNMPISLSDWMYVGFNLF